MAKKKICFEFDTEGRNMAEAFELTESEVEEINKTLSEIIYTSKSFNEIFDKVLEKWDGNKAAAALSNVFRFMGNLEGGGENE